VSLFFYLIIITINLHWRKLWDSLWFSPESRRQAADPQDCPWDITGDGYFLVVSVPDYL